MNDERGIRQVLAEMEVWMSYAPAMNFEPSRGGDGSSGNRPPGEEWPAHLHWRARWERAFNKAKVLEEARDALKAMRKQKAIAVATETEGQLEARVIQDGEGWGVVEIAQHCRCTEKFVRKARMRAGVSLETGKGLIKGKREPTERAKQARAMRGRGLTLRQIAMQLDCDAATIQRDLAKAA